MAEREKGRLTDVPVVELKKKKSKPVPAMRIHELVNEALGPDYVAVTSHLSNNHCLVIHKPTATVVMEEKRNVHMAPRLEDIIAKRRKPPPPPPKSLAMKGKNVWMMEQWKFVGHLQASINLDIEQLKEARPDIQIILNEPVLGEGHLKVKSSGFKAFYINDDGEECVITSNPKLDKKSKQKKLAEDQKAVNRIEFKMVEIIQVMEGQVKFRWSRGVLTALTPEDVVIASEGFRQMAKEST